MQEIGSAGGCAGATGWRARRRRRGSARRRRDRRATRGRERAEEPDEFRTAFERDRDRIIHSKAFRRLKHKTQVFLNPEGDHFVTRLTHTMQVTQVARSLAAALSLNEPLAEAIALGHDVGHSPFGHTGEDALSPVLRAGRVASRRAERPDLRGARGPEPDLGGARRHPRPLVEDRAAAGDRRRPSASASPIASRTSPTTRSTRCAPASCDPTPSRRGVHRALRRAGQGVDRRDDQRGHRRVAAHRGGAHGRRRRWTS